MTVHLIKLSVGSESMTDLEAWQKERWRDMKARGRKPELIHVTRHMPKRAEEILDGGSIYWVIKGWIVARQKLIELREVKKDGVTHCGLVHDRKMIPVLGRQQRAFQGWRYLAAADAPPDRLVREGDDDLPEALRLELAALGLR